MASEYHRGDMEISEQVATYNSVMGMTKWGSLGIAVALLMLTLWFCTDAGFFGGLVPGVVLLVAGVALLREKKVAGH
jgi:thiamine transporter ThiT